MAKWLPRMTRRRFLGCLGGLGVSVGLYAWRFEPHWVEVVECELPIARLPATLAGKTMIQISDLHAGDAVDTDYLISCMWLVSSLHPDMTVITGDFMSCRADEQIDHVASMLENLDAGPLGCYAVLGNHDYSMGWSRPDVADKLVGRLASLGIRTLSNAAENVAGMTLVGIDDLWGPRFRPGDVVPDVDWQGPVLTLCHNPDAVDLPALAAGRGWVLSGHTHGGQCKPPFLPPPILPVKNLRFTRGAFDLGAGRWLYINRGLGYLRRVRFNVRPEITVFHLREA